MPLKNKPHQPSTTTTCPICGSPFTVFAYQIRIGRGKYCSMACRVVARTASRDPLLCLHCGTPFDAFPFEIAAGRRYCSAHCYYAAATTSRALCVHCRVTPIKPGAKHYCSRACLDAASKPNVDTFWTHVEKSANCWTWTSATNDRGYGRFDNRYAHRISWEQAAGPIPDGLNVLHTCDNPPCIRNDDEGWYEGTLGVMRPRRGHLWLGTHADNMADMGRKGRSVYQMHPELRLRRWGNR